MADMSTPLKNVEYKFVFSMYKNDGTLLTPGVPYTMLSKEGAYPSACANAVSVVNATYGYCALTLTATEVNADYVWLVVATTAASCVPSTFALYPATRDDSNNIASTLATVNAMYPNVISLVASLGVALVNMVGISAKTDNLPTNASDALSNVQTAVIAAIPTLASMSGAVWSEEIATGYSVPESAGYQLTNVYDTGALQSTLTSVHSDVDDLHVDVAAIASTLSDVHTDVGNIHTDVGSLASAVAAVKAVVDNVLRWFTNKMIVTSSSIKLRDDGDSTDLYTQTLADDGTTATRGEA